MSLCEYIFPVGSTKIPIELAINSSNGPVDGLGNDVRARIRRIPDNKLFDFADNTFKSSGHTTSEKVLTDVGDGRYRTTINTVTAGLSTDTYLIVEFIVDSSTVTPTQRTALYRISDFEQTIRDKANRT